jgi:uncharacterized protein YicC (UPF0701 family)
MRTVRLLVTLVALGLAAALLLPGLGCRKSSTEPDLKAPRSTKEAAAQLEATFANEDAETKAQASQAAAALRQGQYEKAILTLQTMRARQGASLKQGLAVHNSLVSLEVAIVEAMDAGNQDAKRAYQLLRQLKGR